MTSTAVSGAVSAHVGGGGVVSNVLGLLPILPTLLLSTSLRDG
jgi:hypothetical protein